MKLCLQNVRKLKQNADNRLTRNVCNYVISHWNDYDDKKAIFTDVLKYGCQSGIVGSLIYYNDTTKYFENYRQEIADLVYDLMVNTGVFDMSQLFGDKYDKEDPLIHDITNQNLFAWFGFEETLRNIGQQFECVQNYI